MLKEEREREMVFSPTIIVSNQIKIKRGKIYSKKRKIDRFLYFQ
jgi:hypothetical protein